MDTQRVNVSVIIPAFNRSGTIARAVESVAGQTYRDFELIVVDDHSTDTTTDVVEDLASRHPLRMLNNQRRKGAQGARMTGIDAARGAWIAMLDSDDEYLPEMLEQLVQFADTNPDVDVVTCHCELVSDDSQLPPPAQTSFTWSNQGSIQRGILTGQNYVDTNAAIIRRTKLREIGGLDEECPSYQEWDTHIRLAQVAKYGTVPQILVRYHQHAGQMSKDDAKTVDGMLYILRKHKQQWVTQAGRLQWMRRCLQLATDTTQLHDGRWRRLRQLCSVDPTFPILLPLVPLLRLRRMLSQSSKSLAHQS